MRDDFAVFILSHGRPELISRTIKALTKANYGGSWYIVLDTEDETAPQYRSRWGADRVITFDRKVSAQRFDIADSGGPDTVVVHARNAVEPLAASLGLTYVMTLDDDYDYFAHRYARDGVLACPYSFDLDSVIDAFIKFLDTSGAVTVAFAQGGDFIGGLGGTWLHNPLKRKAMNTFISRVDRPIGFVGRLNEDTTTYVWRGSQGDLFFTVTDFMIHQPDTQSQTGGLTDAYLDVGTYVKSFYSVMFSPSCVKVSTIGMSSHRVHHSISWGHAVPKIVSSRHKAKVAEKVSP